MRYGQSTKAFIVAAILFLSSMPFPAIASICPGDLSSKEHKPNFVELEQLQEGNESEKRSLKNLERLLDTLKYHEAKDEWRRLAPHVQRVKLRRQFADQLAGFYERSIKELLKLGEYKKATEEWEFIFESHPQLRDLLDNRGLGVIWELPQVYVKLGEPDKAIRLYKPHHYVAAEAAETRASSAECLIFGELVPPKDSKRGLIGRGQCTLCHSFAKAEWTQKCGHHNCGPEIYGITKRTKTLLASPEYFERRKNGIQQEALPGSGAAKTVIEYLAESNVCPSCYVVPGYRNWPDERGRQSRMPEMNRPAAFLSRDELIAIDTWILMQEGEQVPSLQEMRSIYDRFLLREYDSGAVSGLFLASLYDAAGNLAEAIRLIEESYPTVWSRDPEKSMLMANLNRWRKDNDMFVHLKEHPELVRRFPRLLNPE